MSTELPDGRNTFRRYFLLTLALILANTLFHLWYIWKGPLDLFPDEAHYWEWSRHPDISYYSKGPMVAYIILVFTRLFGTSAFTVRLGAVVLSAGTGLVIFHIGKEVFRSEKVGFYATAMVFLTPLLNAGSFIMTIDAPFIFFWGLSILAGYRALQGKRRWWYLLAVAAGLGALSKYTMLFIWVSLLLYFVLSRKDRHWLRRKQFYLSLCLCMAILLPVLVWNAKHDWVSFRHLMGQARVQEGLRISPMSFFEFVGSQVGVVTPIFFFGMMYGLWSGLRGGIRQGRDDYLYLFSCGAVVFIGYLLKSLQGKVQPNWAAGAYVPSALLTVAVLHDKISGGVSPRTEKTLRWLGIAAYSIAFLIVLLSHSLGLLRQAGMEISYEKDPTARAIGWKELGQKVSRVFLEMKGNKPTFIFSDRYQTTSELAFYVVGRPQTYNVNLGRRLNQYDFWTGFEECVGWDAIFVCEGDAFLPVPVQGAFDSG